MMDKQTKRAMIAGAVVGAIDGSVIYWSDGILSEYFGGSLVTNVLVASGIGVVIGYLAYKWVTA